MKRIYAKNNAVIRLLSILLTIATLVTMTEIPVSAISIEAQSKKVNAKSEKYPTNPDYDQSTDSTKWSYIYFGSYPQTQVWGDMLTLEIIKATYDSNNCAVVNGTKYLKVRDASSDTGYDYYMYEPIKWRVLHNNGSTLFVMADQALYGWEYDGQYDGTTQYSPVTWNTCKLRRWLNSDFYEDAFNSREQDAIVAQTISNESNPMFYTDGGSPTLDKIYTLSCNEAKNPNFGFNPTYHNSATRQIDASDFSWHGKVRKYYNDDTKQFGCNWCLRTPGAKEYNVLCAQSTGKIDPIGFSARNNYAVVPVMHIDLSSDLWYMDKNDDVEESNIVTSFEMDAKATVILGDTTPIWGKLTIKKDTQLSYDLLKSEFDAIKWISSNHDIVAENDIICSGPSPSDTDASSFFIMITPKKEGSVTITGITSNGLGISASCEVTVTSSVEYKLSEFTIDHMSTAYMNEENSVTGTLKLEKDTKGGSEILISEISNIKWTSDNQGIVNDKDILCKPLGSQGDKSAKYRVTFTPKGCGKVTLTGITKDGGMKAACDIKVIVSLSYRTDGEIKGAESYANTNSKNVKHSYYYSDDFFYTDSTQYNNSLAVMSLGLELSSFSSPKYDHDYKKVIDEKYRAENIVDAYAKLGFENAKYYHYDTPLSDDSDKVAYSIAKKAITNGHSTDTLIAIVVRGGGYGAEWVSNFHVGNNGNAQGFDKAARDILPQLEQYIKSTNIEGELKLWVTGFSRGGATANILAHYINNNNSSIHSTLKEKNIFAYTFATPNGYRKIQADSSSDKNIWNVVSANDLVPKLALGQWGFSKYGNTVVLPEYSSVFMDNNFKAYTGKELNLQNANNAEIALTDVLYDVTLGTKGWTELLEADVMNAVKAVYTKSFLDRVQFGREMIRAVDEVIKAKIGAFKLIYALSCVYGEELFYVVTSSSEEPSIAHVVSNFMKAHYPEYYLCWLEGGSSTTLEDGLYAGLSQEKRNEIDRSVNQLFITNYKKYQFFCPVNIEVYDDKNLVVARIINNKVEVNKIPCFVNGDEKTVYLPDEDTYEIKLIGNDTGTMDYIVQEFNGSSEKLRSIFYYDIPLKDGLVYTDTVTGKILNAVEDYSITDGKTKTVPALDTIGGDKPIYSIDVENGTAGQPKAMENESVSIFSRQDEQYEFVRWTSDAGDSIFDDIFAPVTRIRMPSHNVSIKAVWKKAGSKNEHKISYHLNGGNPLENPISYTEDILPVELKSPVREGYIFLGWTGSNGNIPQKNVTILKGTTGDLNYTANWKQEGEVIQLSYSISYILSGGSVSGNPITYLENDLPVKLKNPTKAGYTFLGWTGSNGNTPQTDVIIDKGTTGNLSYIANWKQIENVFSAFYEITYVLDGGNVIGNPVSYMENDLPIILKDPTKKGYQFIGWTGSNGQIPQKSVIIPYGTTGNLSYTANWLYDQEINEVSYGITYYLDGGSATRNPMIYSAKDLPIMLENPTKSGYTFLGWTGSDGDIPQKNIMITEGSTGNKIYIANWQKIQSDKQNIKKAIVSLKKNSYIYDGKKKQPSVVVRMGSKKLYQGSDYKITYKNNRKVGYASLNIHGIGDYTGTVTVKFKIVPKGTYIDKVVKKTKGFLVSWRKQGKSADGYQIQYSTNKKFRKKSTVTKTIKNVTKTKLQVAKCKPGKKYYIRIRTFKKVKEKKYFSKWSKVRAIVSSK